MIKKLVSKVLGTHEEKETLSVDVFVPGHDPRETTSLFIKTRKALIKTAGGKCYVCGRTAAESGHPLEAHHHPIERSFAEMIDWSEGGLIRHDFPQFDWANFDPANPYKFVDDMTINGVIFCKDHHIGKDEGVHYLPLPLFMAQRYGKEGYQFTGKEVIHHSQSAEVAK